MKSKVLTSVRGETGWPPAALCFLLILMAALASKPAFAQRDLDKRGGPEAGRDNPAARAAWFLRGRTVHGKPAAELLFRAHQRKLQIRQQTLERRQRAAAQANQAPAETGTTSATAPSGGVTPMTVPAGSAWVSLGPAPITAMGRFGDASGRITAVAVDQHDSTGNTVYVGGAYGGVWKSTNAAASDPTTVTWTPLYDTDPAAATLAVGAISLQPTNSSVILVGTGEPNYALDSYYGMGILRSTNGGASWTLITNGPSGFGHRGISKFAWSTSDSNLVVAGVSGETVPVASSYGAIYYSTDAGATWSQASGADLLTGAVSDVVYDAQLGKFFAAVEGQGIYSSSDGSVWFRILNQPAALAPHCDSNSSCDMLRGALAVRPGSADLYAWVVGSDGTTDKGIFKTSDGGATAWTALTVTGINSCGDSAGCGTEQGFYNLVLAAVPNGANLDLYAGAVNLFKCSITAANPTCAVAGSWKNLTHVYGTCSASNKGIHPDMHAIDFLQSNTNIIYFGNDGGAYRTLTGQTGMNVGTCNTSTHNAFQDLNTSSLGSLTQFISISNHPTDDSVVLGGTQDNGSPAIAAGQSSPPLNPPLWYEANGGDGGYNEIDPTNPNNWYVANSDVSISKCTTGINCIEFDVFNPVVTVPTNFPDHGDFYTPYLLDPQLPSKLIIGTCRVWRGNSDGSGFSSGSFTNALSNKLNLNNAGTTACTSSESDYVRSLAAGGPATANGSQVIYTGTSRGYLWVTTNATTGQATWTETSTGIHSGFPFSSIAIDPSDATGRTAYVTEMGFSGYPGGKYHVFKTTNAGGTWTDISAGLPDAPANAVVIDPFDPTLLYVGTDVGVFVTNNGGATWDEYGTGLPNVAVLAMRVFNSGDSHKLRVATHGRGVWEADLAGSLNGFVLTPASSIVAVRPGQTASYSVTAARKGTFSALADLSCDPNPPTSGTSCGISPNPADLATNSSVPVTLTVPTTSDAPVFGDYKFNLHGEGGGKTYDLPLTLRVNDFTLTTYTGTLQITQTTTVGFALDVSGQGNFSDPIHLSCDSFTSSGLTCTFNGNDVAPGTGTNRASVNVTASPFAELASGTFRVVATGGGTTHTVTINYTVNPAQDFIFVTDTPSQTVLSGETAHFTATLVPLNQFAANNMTLFCSGTPNPCVLTPPSPSIGNQTPQPLTIDIPTTAGSTGVSLFTVTARGTNVNNSQLKTHDLQPQPTLIVQNFALFVSPDSRTVAVGAGTTYTVTINGQSGYSGLVTLNCNAPPAGVICSFWPAAVNAASPGATSTLTVLTAPNITTGTKVISVIGTSGGQTRSAVSVGLVVSSTTPSFTLTNSTPTKIVPAGSSTTYTLNVKSTTATSPGTVTLSCVPPLPSGVGCAFVPASLTPNTTGTNVTATVTTTSGTPAAAATITFQGATTAPQLRQVNGTLQVTDFSLVVSPSSKTILTSGGGSTTYDVALTSLDGFASSVTLSCPTPPTGVSCGFAPASLTPTVGGAHSTLTLTTSASAAVGPINFIVKGVSGSLTHTQTVEVFNGAPVAPTAVSVTPSAGAGTSQTFSLLYSDGNGFADIAHAYVLINSALTYTGSCAVHYVRASNSVFLVHDDGGGWFGPLPLGQAGSLQNSQCTLNVGASSSVAGSGNNLTLNLALTFQPAFAGTKNVYLYVNDRENLASGWQTRGSWNTSAPVAPTAVSVTPSAGAGTSQTFSLLYSDGNGFADIAHAYVLINSALTYTGSCAVHYVRASNSVFLVHDDGGGWFGPLPLGQAGSLQNSQCTLNVGASSSVAGSGNNLTLNLALTFQPVFAGTKNVYLYVNDREGLASGWQTRGSWNTSAVAPTAVSVTPNSGTGSTQTFAFLYSDAGGAGKISYIQALINGSFAWQNACAVLYYQSTNKIYLVQDSGTGWQGPLTVGQAGMLQNSQCTLNAGASSILAVGNNLTVNAALTFKPAFAGSKTVYMDAEDTPNKLSSGWQSRGTWTVPASAPTAVSVTPSSGTGSSQTFAFLFSDASGANKITYIQGLINGSLAWQNACAVLYYQSTNKIYLAQDSGTGWQGPLTVGQVGTLQNSQCTLDAGASSVSAVGNTLTVNAALSFKPAFGGAKTVFLDAEDTPNHLSSGWQTLGSWTVP